MDTKNQTDLDSQPSILQVMATLGVFFAITMFMAYVAWDDYKVFSYVAMVLGGFIAATFTAGGVWWLREIAKDAKAAKG